MRFGTHEELPRGWRSSLAAWLGREDLAAANPGAVAACAPSVAARPSMQSESSTLSRPSILARPSPPPARGTPTSHWVWLAEPVHLTASLTSVHLAPQGRLRLNETDQAQLCGAFNEAFAETGYTLVPTRSGRFLAIGPPLPEEVATIDPARCLGSTIADALPRGHAAGALRRLGSEIEMWLHEQPLNVQRARAGRAPVSALWLWGGGSPLAEPGAPLLSRELGAPPLPRGPGAEGIGNRSPTNAIFGDDPYVEGLSHLVGVTCGPAARSLASIAAAADRAIVQLELFSPSAEPGAPSGEPAAPSGASDMPMDAIAMPLAALAAPDALAAFDRQWIEPALERLSRREIERLVVVANDRRVSMMRRDRLKRWRRPRSALVALAAQRRP